MQKKHSTVHKNSLKCRKWSVKIEKPAPLHLSHTWHTHQLLLAKYTIWTSLFSVDVWSVTQSSCLMSGRGGGREVSPVYDSSRHSRQYDIISFNMTIAIVMVTAWSGRDREPLVIWWAVAGVRSQLSLRVSTAVYPLRHPVTISVSRMLSVCQTHKVPLSLSQDWNLKGLISLVSYVYIAKAPK